MSGTTPPLTSGATERPSGVGGEQNTVGPRVVLAARGDALVRHLSAALEARYDVVAEVDAELTTAQRLVTAAATFRPSRRAWVERFYKSGLAVQLRSHNGARALGHVASGFDVIVQTHALFEVDDARAVMYVDCTHAQSAEQWPDWNPLRGRALASWYARERRQYQRAAHVFAFSVETARSLQETYGLPDWRVSVVGAGANVERLPTLVPHPDDAPTVLFIGNDFVRKGGPLLLRAFARVRERLPQARLRIVGTPYPVAPQEGVEVLGRVKDRAEVSRLYREANVFCLPAVFDPFPLVVLEAMAHGLPVVATPTCGVPEMVTDGGTGLLVPSGDESRLVEALVGLLERPHAAARLGASGRRRVEERFLWSHVVDRMAPVLDALAPGRRPGVPGRPQVPSTKSP